ncbi:hypothetical protein [Acinetobacter lwoffii]|uniref:hypothetical protein n=1 Tax=Acinetobacter lwoffii TaxID=28090 RepID=UPI003BF75255
MQILLLVIGAYLFLPILGELTLLITGDQIVAGDVTWGLFFSNLIYSSIVYGIILFFYISKKNNKIGFIAESKDKRTVKRIAVFITFLCLAMFYFSGYDYLIRGIHRGEIRIEQGLLGFVSKWIMIYAIPVLFFINSVIVYRNRKIFFLNYYIYLIGALSAIFTGYKFVLVFCFIPVLVVALYHKNIVKTLLLVAPMVLLVLTITTKFVMNYDSYLESFNFLIHRMTIMSAFGTIGVWNYYPNGASFSEVMRLTYSIFGNKINHFIFGIEFNSIEILDTNLSRKMTYLVYPSWETALSGTSNITVTNFGEAIYIFGKNYWIYAVACGGVFSFVILKLITNINKGNIIKSSMYLIYILSVLLVWLNSSSIFTLFSLPVFIYLLMTYIMLMILLKTKF